MTSRKAVKTRLQLLMMTTSIWGRTQTNNLDSGSLQNCSSSKGAFSSELCSCFRHHLDHTVPQYFSLRCSPNATNPLLRNGFRIAKTFFLPLNVVQAKGYILHVAQQGHFCHEHVPHVNKSTEGDVKSASDTLKSLSRSTFPPGHPCTKQPESLEVCLVLFQQSQTAAHPLTCVHIQAL